jgi:hypothetical protein
MSRRVAVVRTDVSEELSASIIRVMAIVVPSSPSLVTLMMEEVCSSKRCFLQEAHGVTFLKMAFFIVSNAYVNIHEVHMVI